MLPAPHGTSIRAVHPGVHAGGLGGARLSWSMATFFCVQPGEAKASASERGQLSLHKAPRWCPGSGDVVGRHPLSALLAAPLRSEVVLLAPNSRLVAWHVSVPSPLRPRCAAFEGWLAERLLISASALGLPASSAAWGSLFPTSCSLVEKPGPPAARKAGALCAGV